MLRSKEREDLASQLALAQRRVAELEAEMARRALRDPLVGNALTLPAFRAQLDVELRRCQRYERPVTVAVISLDSFANINNDRGYAAGDVVLTSVGNLIDRVTRVNDVTCRVGGDEFALMLPETDAEAAKGAAQRVLSALEEFEAGAVRGLSASIGLCQFLPGQTPDDILNAARQAVLEARAHGGGRTATWTGRPPAPDEEVQRGGGDVAAALAAALEERDNYTGEHSESVVELTGRVAEGLGLSGDDVARVRMAALLHDIGKVGIPDSILNKPGPLTPEEWEVMREHPAIGERILRAIPGLGSIARVVRHEHERWDGGGYPDGLKGAEIPLEARIILACDAYHAMVSDRPYRRAMPHPDAIGELTRGAGTQFDPEVVEMLIGYLYGRRQAGHAA